MKREDLAQQYRRQYEHTEEKSADWYVYGHAYSLFAGSGTLAWVRKELIKAREQSLQYATSFGFYPDCKYGTYGVYMQTKANLYKSVLNDLNALESLIIWQQPEELKRQAPKYIDSILQDIAAGRTSVENIQTELAETALSNWELEPAKSIIAALESLGEHVPTDQEGE